MKNKNAQANIIVTILIILIVLAAIIILWNVINVFLEDSTSDVQLGSFINNVELISAKEDSDGNINLIV